MKELGWVVLFMLLMLAIGATQGYPATELMAIGNAIMLRCAAIGLPIELVIAVDSKLVARFDEGRVARAVHNLARNALEAMAEKGGRLTIAAELRDEGLAISIADNGPGIPKEIEDRVFQSFVTLGKRGGTGLGLAIVKKIVDEHGGRIDLQNSSAGARFELVIPQPSRDAGAPSVPGNQTKGMPRRWAKRICLPYFSAVGATSVAMPRRRSAAATRSHSARRSSAGSATRTQVGTGRDTDSAEAPKRMPSMRETPIEMPTPG